MHDLFRFRRTWWVIALLALPVFAPCARAQGASMLTLGSNLGVSILIPDNGDNVTLFTVPDGSPLIATGPGFRLGYVSPDRGLEMGLGLGVWYASSNGESSHSLLMGIDLEKHFAGANPTGPYLGVQGGLSSTDLFTETTQPWLGAGLGLRHVVGDGNGAIKFGLHVRQFFESDEAGSYTVVNLAMAFDLWIPS